MATFYLSRLAEKDLLDIGFYTLQNWGPSQTLRYLGELEHTCQRLADLPTLGRLCE